MAKTFNEFLGVILRAAHLMFKSTQNFMARN